MEFGALLSKFQNKLHDFTMRENKLRCHGNEIYTCDLRKENSNRYT